MLRDKILRAFFLKSIQSVRQEGPAGFFQRHITSFRNIDWQEIAGQWMRIFLPLYAENSFFHASLESLPGVKEQVKLQYVRNAAKNQEYILAIRKLAQLFQASGREIVFLKGSAYLATIYADDPGIRFMADIDVLIRKADLPTAINILEQEGFRQDYERFDQEMGVKHKEAFFARQHFHFIFYKGNLKLELHWNISFSPPEAVLEKIFDTLVTVRMGDTMIRIPSPEAALYMACDNFQRDYGYIDLSDCFSEKRISRRTCATLFFLFEFKKILAYYQDSISWDNFFFICKECGTLFSIESLLSYSCSFTLQKLPAAVLKNGNPGIPLRIYKGLLRYTHKNNFIRAFMLRNIFLCLSNGELFGKSPKNYLTALVRAITYYLSFENRIVLIVFQAGWRPIRFLKWALGGIA